jgi:hypothetical protein
MPKSVAKPEKEGVSPHSAPHVDGFLLIHVVKDNILWVADLISPRGPITRNSETLAVGEALRKRNITGALIAGPRDDRQAGRHRTGARSKN